MEKENLLERGIKSVETLEKRKKLNAEKMDDDMKRLASYVNNHSIVEVILDITIKISFVAVIYVIFSL